MTYDARKFIAQKKPHLSVGSSVAKKSLPQNWQDALDHAVNVLDGQGAVGAVAVRAVPKNENASRERLRVNLVLETNGEFCSVDKALVVDVERVLADVHASEQVGLNRALDVAEALDVHGLDGLVEWVTEDCFIHKVNSTEKTMRVKTYFKKKKKNFRCVSY